MFRHTSTGGFDGYKVSIWIIHELLDLLTYLVSCEYFIYNLEVVSVCEDSHSGIVLDDDRSCN